MMMIMVMVMIVMPIVTVDISGYEDQEESTLPLALAECVAIMGKVHGTVVWLEHKYRRGRIVNCAEPALKCRGACAEHCGQKLLPVVARRL